MKYLVAKRILQDARPSRAANFRLKGLLNVLNAATCGYYGNLAQHAMAQQASEGLRNFREAVRWRHRVRLQISSVEEFRKSIQCCRSHPLGPTGRHLTNSTFRVVRRLTSITAPC